MAEMPRQLTQAEIDRILFNQRMGMQPTPPSIENLRQGTSGTVTSIPDNFFQRAATGARAAGQFVNQAGTAADIAKLFPGYTGQSQVNIPTGFNFAPKQDPMGGVIPGGLQTQQLNVDQLLKAIKPADVLGLTGAQQAYTDVGMGKAPNPMDVLDIAGLGAVGYGAGKGLLKVGKNVPVGLSIQDAPGLLQTAPKSDIGFYSAVEQAAMASPRKSATGQAFLNDIMKGQDVRADEIKWLGLDDYLKGKQNVTKREVQDYIANNRVNVEEVRSTIPRLPGEEMPGDKGAFLPKFGQYTLPGGENYRELLLTMPSSKTAMEEFLNIAGKKYGGDTPRNQWSPEDNATYEKLLQEERSPTKAEFRSSHFSQPNVLAHLRVNDRVDADGKKMLLIEEVQSDWHQAGREKGYAKNVKDELNALKKRLSDFGEQRDPVTNQMINEQEWFDLMKERDELIKQSMGVPDAPFKDTWYQLALKRAIQHAAENGYDRIGLTTGSRQAERFDLSKQVKRLVVSKTSDGYRVGGVDVNDNPFDLGVKQSNELSAAVGKELAEKIAKQESPNEVYAGKDLVVGGEGMKKYYDEIYPKFLDKYGKKWNARVGETKVNADGLQEPIRYLDITPEMKAGVSKGQPLFQAAPIVGTGLLGSQQDERR
jgi:hypothetical protein